ncbi:MAG TPA: hypothetical protein ENN55_02975, partial [Firmicutes bacterium]|nr:hypothetical protein [Bacillota bacterium]
MKIFFIKEKSAAAVKPAGILSVLMLFFMVLPAGINASEFRGIFNSIIPTDGNFDFPRTVMELSALADPQLNVNVELSRIETMAGEIKKRLRPNASGAEAVYGINEYIYGVMGFRFDEHANEYIFKKTVNPASVDMKNYESLRIVMRERQGICVSLSMLY